MPVRNIVAGAAALAAALSFSVPAMSAGALSVAKCGGYGYSINISSIEEARRIALRKCESEGNEDCRLVLDFHSFCVAFAYDEGSNCGAEGWGSGPEKGAAEDSAIRQCINHSGGNCTVKTSICDAGD